MPGTYRDINYSLRPAKAVERKMLCDTIRRLHPFGKIESYRYVGFGSLYFSDFHLFHRALGLHNMLSIEKDAYAKETFEFNKPYRCVDLDFRPSSQVLPQLNWDSKAIVWLDYDGKLDEAALSDVHTVCAKACSGTLFLISVNVKPEPDPDEPTRLAYAAETGLAYSLDTYRLREFSKAVGSKLPPEIQGKDLRGKGLASMSKRIIGNAIQDALSARNATVSAERKIQYRQILHFLYSDGAQMMTVGGILFEARDQPTFNACSFSELAFAREADEPYTIKVPCLTLKEINYLNVQLPKTPLADLTLPGVRPSDISQYAEIYRYFPTFTEAIFV